MSQTPSAAAPSQVAPHIVLTDFLAPAAVAALLADTLALQSQFKPATVNYGGGGQGVDPRYRVSWTLPDFGPQSVIFRAQAQARLAELGAALATPAFVPMRVETELAAHGDGAFFSRHADAAMPEPGRSLRLISGVYYFHASPKGFDGGALRLHGSEGRFSDIAPIHNSLVAFPSWVPHEVMPVACPSGRFADSRFAINCWFHGVLR